MLEQLLQFLVDRELEAVQESSQRDRSSSPQVRILVTVEMVSEQILQNPPRDQVHVDQIGFRWSKIMRCSKLIPILLLKCSEVLLLLTIPQLQMSCCLLCSQIIFCSSKGVCV